MGGDGILLDDGQIDHLIVRSRPDQHQVVLELRVESAAKPVLFLRVGVNMVPGILSKIVERLAVL